MVSIKETSLKPENLLESKLNVLNKVFVSSIEISHVSVTFAVPSEFNLTL